MNKQQQVWAIGGFVVIVVLLFGVSYYISQSNDELKTGESQIGNVDGDVNVDAPRVTITAKHQYKNGKHIVAGEIEVPTPCHILDWNIRQVERDIIGEGAIDQGFYINFVSSTLAEVCAQVITPARFKVEFEGNDNAFIEATFNGTPIVLNLIEVGSDEDLDEFELFIKG